MLGAAVALYGPRTTMIYYNDKLKQVDEVTLLKSGGKLTWTVTKEKIAIKESTNLFSPGNSRAASESKAYREVVDYWLDSAYTLRYSGAMASDIYQIFIKGEGVFSCFMSKKHPAKLRYLYETAPFAFLIEAAGGNSTDGRKSLLETEITDYQMKGPIAVGSRGEIERIEKVFKA